MTAHETDLAWATLHARRFERNARRRTGGPPTRVWLRTRYGVIQVPPHARASFDVLVLYLARARRRMRARAA